jgi:hypothetical protein
VIRSGYRHHNRRVGRSMHPSCCGQGPRSFPPPNDLYNPEFRNSKEPIIFLGGVHPRKSRLVLYRCAKVLGHIVDRVMLYLHFLTENPANEALVVSTKLRPAFIGLIGRYIQRSTQPCFHLCAFGHFAGQYIACLGDAQCGVLEEPRFCRATRTEDRHECQSQDAVEPRTKLQISICHLLAKCCPMIPCREATSDSVEGPGRRRDGADDRIRTPDLTLATSPRSSRPYQAGLYGGSLSRAFPPRGLEIRPVVERSTTSRRISANDFGFRTHARPRGDAAHPGHGGPCWAR